MKNKVKVGPEQVVLNGSGARLTNLVLLGEYIRLMHENLEVEIGMLVICRDYEVHKLLDRLLVEILPKASEEGASVSVWLSVMWRQRERRFSLAPEGLRHVRSSNVLLSNALSVR